MSNSQPSADLSTAQRFLRALDPSEIFSFQTFDDDDKRKRPALARVLHGTLDDHAATLSALNQQGAGVFVMVNQGDFKGRAAVNVQKVRALFVDLDGAPLEPVLQCGMPPHIVSDTSAGRWHAYWLVSDCALQDFTPLQQALAAKFSGDPSVKDLPRVMRLPGFYHCKGEPTLATVRSIEPMPPYTLAQLTHGLALTPAPQLRNGPAFASAVQSVNANALGGIRIAANPEEICPEGDRNNRMASLAGRWIVEGKTFDELITLASDWNQRWCSPALADAEVGAVCRSIWQKHEREQPPRGVTTASVYSSGWEEPILFTEYATPDIPASLLPGVYGEFAAALATATETPEPMSVFAVLGTLSAALAKRFVVSPHQGWAEPLNIYTLVALPPANNKSLVLSRCTTPLREWEIAQAICLEPEITKQKSERRNQEKLIESCRTKAVGAKDPAERERLFREINELEAKLPHPKNLPQLFANDSTPEALAQNVHEQGGRFAIISDEGGIVETLSGLYSGGTANVDIILKGVDGGDVRVRRKERSYDLKPFLTFMLIVQPRIIQNMGERQAFQGNGMLERFLYVLPVSKLGYRTLDTAPVPNEVQVAYGQAVRRLLEIQPIVDERGQEQPQILTLAPDAAFLFTQLRHEVEVGLRPGGTLHGCLGWGGKLAGYSLRLAGLLHIAEHGEQIKVISASTMERAAYIALLLIDHARAAFNLMGVDQAIEDAKAVFDWIKASGKLMFTKTECLKALHGRFTKAPRLAEALKVLADRNIVSGPDALVTTPGKRPTMTFRVNPMVLGAG
jgi:hypothetical protein